jgi:hypothetical protein
MTTMIDARYYDIIELENMAINSHQYILSKNILDLLTSLDTEVYAQSVIDNANVITYRIPSDVSKRFTNDNNKLNDKRKHGNGHQSNIIVRRTGRNAGESSEIDWSREKDKQSDSGIQFKITKMETKEGVDKHINDIRVALNKISIKNYDVQRDVIITNIELIYKEHNVAACSSEVAEPEYVTLVKVSDEIVEQANVSCHSEHSEHITKIATSIFDIASSNKFFSELYAELYRELINKFSVFRAILTEFISKFNDTIQHIHYVDSNTDYDGFCNYTKSNDNRKATSMFIVNLMKKEVLAKDVVMKIIDFFMERVFTYMDEPNRTNEVEEITENIFIFISHSQRELSDLNEWTAKIVPKITAISKMKVSEHKSISNRVIFKYMDLIDSLKKK